MEHLGYYVCIIITYFCGSQKGGIKGKLMSKISINLKEGTIERSDTIIGIDLGTTNSVVAYMRDGYPVTVKSAEGSSVLVPSIVHFDEHGDILVGDSAKKQLIQYPQRTIFSVKRLLGKSYGDLSQHQSFFSYRIIDDETESLVKVAIQDKFYNPIELSAHILKFLKDRVEGELSKTVSKAVITVPAYFNDSQRQATRDAGKLAGLDVLRIVNEPTAASLAYGIEQQNNVAETIAVYDLGGGTFDISILHLENGIYEVLSTHGDTFLGGDDIDRLIVQHWLHKYNLQTKAEDRAYRQALRLAAEEAKKTLTTSQQYKGSLDDVTLELSLQLYNELIAPVIEKTLEACRNALKDAKLSTDEIDHVVMVGGSTRIPYLKERVGDFFSSKVNDSLDPDEVVAMGAAIQADILAGNQKDMLLLDVTPLSLGIETIGNLMDVILPRNSKIPASVARNYTTSVDGQKNLKISIYQGERDLVEDNRKLGEFILKNIPPMPAGIPKIEVAFTIDADGILKVRARELRSGLEQQIEIKSTYGISEEEMSKMLIDSLNHAQDDIAEKAIREAINEANYIVLSTEKFIQQNDKLFADEILKELLSLNINLKETIKSRDKNLIEKAMENLNSYAAPLAHEAMDHHVGKAIKGRSV